MKKIKDEDVKRKIMRVNMSIDLEVLLKDESPETLYKTARNYVTCLGDKNIKIESARIIGG